MQREVEPMLWWNPRLPAAAGLAPVSKVWRESPQTVAYAKVKFMETKARLYPDGYHSQRFDLP